MEATVAFLILFSIVPGTFSSSHVTQSGPAMVKPGGSFKMTCIVSRFRVSDYYWHWMRQLPRRSVESLGFIRSTSREGTIRYNPAFSSRISVTRDTSRNEVYLQMSSLTAADTALYYCVRGTVRRSNGASRQKPHSDATSHTRMAGFWSPTTTVPREPQTA